MVIFASLFGLNFCLISRVRPVHSFFEKEFTLENPLQIFTNLFFNAYLVKNIDEFCPVVGKRLRGYVLTCFQWFPTFVFQNPNESKMETKEMVISAQAAKLYERTWARFNQMLSIIPTMTLRSLCRDSRVNYCGMQEWMAQHGYAEPERADTGKGRASDPIGTSEENPTFLQLNPVSLPQSMAHDILRQVSITFSEGTVLTLQECSPEGVVSLLDTYARRRSAMEGTCLR